MKKVVITICALGLVHLGLSAQKKSRSCPFISGVDVIMEVMSLMEQL